MSDISSSQPASITHKITGANGQTANLFVVEVYGGTDKFVIDSDGDVTVTGNFTLTGSLAYTGEMAITGDTAATITLKVTAATSQSADIFVVEQNDGTDKFKIAANGDLTHTGAQTLTGNIGLTGNITQTGNQVVTGNVDISGEFFAKGAMPPADYVVMLDGSTYKAFSCRTGDLLTSSATYATVYAAALAALSSGNGVIIDMTDGKGPAPTVNRYESGKLYDPELMLSDRPKVKPLKVFSAFDEGYASWTLVSGDATIEDDSTNYIAGTKSIKLTTVTPASPTYYAKSLGYTWDMRPFNRYFYTLRVWWDDYAEASTYGGAVFMVFYNSGRTQWRRIWLNPAYRQANDYGETGAWQTYWASYADMGESASFDETAVTDIGIGIWAPSLRFHAVSFDEFAVYANALPHPVVVLQFDDHDYSGRWTSVVKPALTKHGMHATANWTISAYPTEGETMRNLVEQGGWEMGCHSMTHPTFPVAVATALDEMIVNLRWLQHYGILPKWRSYTTPGGKNSREIIKALAPYFHSACLGEEPSNTEHGYWTVPDPYIYTQKEATTEAAMETYVSELIGRPCVIPLLWHTISETDWTAAYWETFLTYLEGAGVEVLTWGELFEKYGISRSEYTDSATIAAGSTYVPVPHGLARTPALGDIQITPQGSMLGRTWWVSDVGATTFRINMSTSDTIDHVFSWSAVI